MQILQPLAIGDVGLSARHILHMLRIDKADLKSSCFENLVHRIPIDTRGLHRYGTNPALFKPIREDVEIPRERWETPHRLWISVSSDGHVQLAGPYIDAGRVRMQYQQSVASSLALLGHLLLRGCRSDARGAETEQTPNRDRCREPASVITRLYATPDPRFSAGLHTEHQCRRGL